MQRNALQRNALFGFLLAVALVVAGCDSAGNVAEPDGPKLFERTNTLDERMSAPSQPGRNLFQANPDLRLQERQAKRNAAGAAADTLEIRQVGQLDPPVVDGDTVAASHLRIGRKGEHVYVGYITPDVPFGGAVDILEASDPTDPQRGESLESEFVDVGAVADQPPGLYVAGAVSPAFEGEISFDSPAAVFRLDRRTLNIKDAVDLASGAATDINIAPPGKVFTVTGKSGGKLYRLNPSLKDQASAQPPNEDLRSVTISGDQGIFVLNGDGTVYEAVREAETLILKPLGNAGAGIREATIAKMRYDGHHGGRLYIPLNDGGFTVLNAQTGAVVDGRSNPYYTSLTVGSEGKYVYAAAADTSGIVNVFEWWGPNGSELQKVGHVEIGGFQANLVASVGDYLFAANGEEGTIILKVRGGNNDDGDDDNGDDD